MGCDIHSFAEVRREGKWERVYDKIFQDGDEKIAEPFSWRSYGMFGFLAGVRNYSRSPVIVEPRGLPIDSEYLNQVSVYRGNATKRTDIEEDYDYHSKSHIYLHELLTYDYDQVFEDRRGIEEGRQGPTQTVREFLMEGFFEEIEVLQTLGPPAYVRIVFWFDN